MANDLAKFGIIPNKTYLTNHLPEVPKKFLKDFLRGLLDGDGSIYQETKTKNIELIFVLIIKLFVKILKIIVPHSLEKKIQIL